MLDERTHLEKLLWNTIGEPLYYCSECLRVVRVNSENDNVIIKRVCDHHEAQVIAPRKSVLSGKGFAGLTLKNKIKSKAQQIGAKITGRNV